ncbi:MAG: NADH-quinone oxidoreductase subunit H [Lachnospiraceae bacterium]|jgi:NADH-quinone oxidoreductase subunit H|nr:NADH-quinone oxidoreductase subunit H [Lachnospiraceae bacterium]MCI1726528.1 NADH-quinone oxidoreductase subunit H [Lachnospiraceae bacterium]
MTFNPMYLFYILVFPGFLFTSFAGLLLAGIDRKVLAHMQKRIGPPITQPFYDFMKLMGKETIVPDAAPKAVFLGAPVIGLISLFVTALLIPFAGLTPFYGIADIIVLIYLLTIPAVAIIIGGAASGSPFSGVGISREMVTIVSYELPLILVLLTVGKKAGMALTGGMTFSLIDISAYQAQNGMMITHWAMIPAAIAFLLIIPGEVGTQPFDVAEAETEICEGTMAEYSGAPLALFELSHSIKMFIMTALFTALFLQGWTTGIVALDAVIDLAICILLTIITMTLPHASAARLKVEWLFRFYWQIVAGLALISLILVWLGL